jgi:hypothetical protein
MLGGLATTAPQLWWRASWEEASNRRGGRQPIRSVLLHQSWSPSKQRNAELNQSRSRAVARLRIFQRPVVKRRQLYGSVNFLPFLLSVADVAAQMWNLEFGLRFFSHSSEVS